MTYTDIELQNLSRSSDELVRKVACEYYVERGELQDRLVEAERKDQDGQIAYKALAESYEKMRSLLTEGEGDALVRETGRDVLLKLAEKERDGAVETQAFYQEKFLSLRDGYDAVKKAAEALLDLVEHMKQADIEVPIWIAEKSATAISLAKEALK